MPSSELAGMNELEGSVLLEADDYRRLFNEVKALKTALLKLKRELQEEVNVSLVYQVPSTSKQYCTSLLLRNPPSTFLYIMEALV